MAFVSPPRRPHAPTTPRTVRKSLAGAALALGLGAAALVPIQTASSAPVPAPADGVYDVLGQSWGVSAAEAQHRLDAEHALAGKLETLTTRLAATPRATQAVPAVDGAFFDAQRRLVVNVNTTQAADAATAAGLTPRKVTRGERALSDLQTRVQALADRSGSTQVQSIGADLPTDRLLVVLQPGQQSAKTTALVRQLQAVPGVAVSTSDTTLTPTADVIGGQIMDLVPGTNCSLGFSGTTGNGNNVMLSAGHCVEGNPDVQNRSGVHLGKGVASRFRTGQPSVDMGLMDIDPEDVGQGFIDNRNGQTTRVTGSSKAPVGATICKAGNTTGWTCGNIQQYNLTVNYGGGGSVTRTSGLARSTVCTEGGDSGGAYISGTTAQGMTSGGPVNGVDCGFNQGGNATGSYSFYQPVVDAANFYGVTLTRG